MKIKKVQNAAMTLPELILAISMLTAFTGMAVMVTTYTARFFNPLNVEVKEVIYRVERAGQLPPTEACRLSRRASQDGRETGPGPDLGTTSHPASFFSLTALQAPRLSTSVSPPSSNLDGLVGQCCAFTGNTWYFTTH